MNERDLSLAGLHGAGRSHDEIAAEITDHLAAAEAELTKGGSTTEEAQAAARKKFGDVKKIKQTCYWIQNGETIMRRWTLIALASALCLLLGLSVLGNWRTQSQLAEQVGKLSEELKAMAAAKQTPPAAPQPPEITGVIYARTRDKPVVNAKVAILRSDGTVVRRTTCDKNGVYHSGPLEPGDYSVTTPIQEATPSYDSDLVTQSQPVFVHGTSGNNSLDLDAAYHAGGVKLSVSRDLPEIRKEKKYLILSRLNLFAVRSRQRTHPWTATENSPESWPIYCSPEFPINRRNSFSARGIDIEGSSPASQTFKLKKGEERELCNDYGSTVATILPPGETEIEATLSFSIVPLNDQGDVPVPPSMMLHWSQGDAEFKEFMSERSGFDYNKPRPIPPSVFDKEYGSARRYLSGGKLWASTLSGKSQQYPEYGMSRQTLPRQRVLIKDREITKIVVDIPEGIEDEVQKVVESTSEAEKFIEQVRKDLLRRSLAFRVAGYEAMPK